MSELSDLLSAALPKGWSGRQLSREAAAKGFRLSPASANNYLNGRHGTPDDDTIAAFVAVLPVSDTQVRRASGVSAVGDPWSPPDSSRYLTSEQRRILSLLISNMTKRREDVGNDDRSAATKQAGGSPAESASAGAASTDELDDLRRRQQEADSASVEHIEKQAAETREES